MIHLLQSSFAVFQSSSIKKHLIDRWRSGKFTSVVVDGYAMVWANAAPDGLG
jgi:hypothetical protein